MKPVCVDDYGVEVYRGHYSGVLVWADRAVFFGAVIPQCNSRYLDDPVLGKEGRRTSFKAFCDSEGNCNTCRHLERTPHAKRRDGFLEGRCRNPVQIERHPYRSRFVGDVMIFHPDDWMGMPCYESRWDV